MFVVHPSPRVLSAAEMIHTPMEVDSHPSLASSSPSIFRGSIKSSRMSKRERSPDSTDTGADRPSVRIRCLRDET